MEPQQPELKFYNTVGLTDHELDMAIKDVKKQGNRIYQILRLSGYPMTPFEILDIYCRNFRACPITSIRRALTNLTDSGLLIKTAYMKTERYGKPNYKWVAI